MSIPVAPDVLVALRCPCGVEISAADDVELVQRADAHLVDVHPRLAGTYTAEDVLALAYRKPASADLGTGTPHRLENRA